MAQTLVQTQTQVQASAVAQPLVQNQTLLGTQLVAEIQECPICLEEIVGLKNRVTTECGHTFHCRCLLTNIAHNGFGCPFCRAELADEVQDSDAESEYDSDEDGPARYEDSSDDDASRASDYDSEQDDLDGELEYIKNEIVKMKDDHVLRGFRWLFQPLNAEEEIAEEVAEEAAEEEEEDASTVWETDSDISDEDISAAAVLDVPIGMSVGKTSQVLKLIQDLSDLGFSVDIHSKEEDEDE